MTRVLCLALAVVSSAALAQGAAKQLEDKKAITYNEIERGFFFEARGGFWGVINPPARAGGFTEFSPGQALGVELGYDIGERISPSLFFIGSSNRMSSQYSGLATTPASGDFGALTPGAALKFRLVGFNDSQEVQRTWIYVRGAAGVVFYSPQALLPTLDVMISAGPGIEYFTRLRHFVIGLEANFNFMALTGSMGFSILPTVKYAF
jgi:hypothetical protein